MSTSHSVVTREAWNAARKELLAQEKQFTHLRDKLSQSRRDLPWVRIEQEYAFQCAKDGRRTLSDLFRGKSQLVVYHLMFAPEWEAACKSCSFWADGFTDSLTHLAHRDVSLVAISRAPAQKLVAYATRMGWAFPWYSSEGSSFNYDFAVSFSEQQRASGQALYNFGTQEVHASDMPGFSVFTQQKPGAIFHTYSCYARGIDMMNATYQLLDLTPRGRQEDDGRMSWLRRHDEYEQ